MIGDSGTGFSKIHFEQEGKIVLNSYCIRIPVIYYLPKVHENPINPPGRPIIRGLDSVTFRVGTYIDNFLQPLVSKTPSY